MKKTSLLNLCREYLSYDPKTGTVTWIKQKGAARAGSVAGYVGKKGCSIRIEKRSYVLSHIIWLLKFGRLPKNYIDHKDHDVSNHKLKNLREATHRQNLQNTPLKKNNTSGVCGVYFSKDRRKWSAFIRGDNRKIIALGRYKDFNDAVIARKKAEKKFGYHPNHGVKNGSHRL